MDRPIALNIRDCLILLLIVIGFYWKLTLTDQFTMSNDPDEAQQVLPWYAFEARQIQAAHLPLWDPHSWGGQSLIGQAQPGVCFPLNWLLFLLGFHHGSLIQVVRWVNFYYVAIHLLGAWFMYALARDLHRSRFASIISGFAFTASAYMATMSWPQRLNGAIWTPLIFLFLIRVWRGRESIRNAAFSGACLGAAFLSGHHEAPLFIGLSVAACWCWFLYENRRTTRLRDLLASIAIFGLFTGLLSAVQVIPELEYGKLAIRWLGTETVDWNHSVPYSIHAQLSLLPRSLIGIVIPWFSDSPPFLGWALLAVAFVGLVHCWRSPEVKLFFSVALGGLLFSLGRSDVFHGLIYSLAPMMEKARFAGFAVLLLGFGASVLLSYGIDVVGTFQLEYRQWSVRVLRVLLISAALLMMCTVFVYGFGSQTLNPDFLMLSGFTALCCAGILYAWWTGSIQLPAARILLVGLMALELGNVAPPVSSTHDQGWKFLDPLQQYGDIAAFMRAQDDHPRLETDSDAIPFNFGDWYGVDTFNGYLASVTQNVFRLDRDDGYRCRMLFATKFYAGKKPRFPDQVPVFVSRDGITVYRSPQAFPRVWITHRLTTVPPAETKRRLQSGLALLDESFTSGPAPALQSCASQDKTHINMLGADKEVISTEASCPALLVDSAAYYPGWRARIDGRAGEILQVDGALRGVPIPAGRHTVEFYYRPTSVISGVALTLIGIVLVFLLALRRLPRLPGILPVPETRDLPSAESGQIIPLL